MKPVTLPLAPKNPSPLTGRFHTFDPTVVCRSCMSSSYDNTAGWTGLAASISMTVTRFS